MLTVMKSQKSILLSLLTSGLLIASSLVSISHAQERLTEEEVESAIREVLPAVMVERILGQISDVMNRYGTDSLQFLVRQYANRSLDRERFKSQILQSTGGQVKILEVDGSDTEIETANSVLEKSGLEFIQFVKSSQVRLPPVPSPKLGQDTKSLRNMSLVVSSSFAFGICVLAGVIELTLHQKVENGGALLGQLRPYIGIGVVSSLQVLAAHRLEPFWRKELHQWWSPGFLPSFNWPTLIETFRHKGVYAYAASTFVLLSLLNLTGQVLAALPMNPVEFAAKGWGQLVVESILLTLAAGGAKFAFDALERRGAHSAFQREYRELTSRFIIFTLLRNLGFARSLDLFSNVFLGAYVMIHNGLYAIKVASGDQAFQEDTARRFGLNSSRPGWGKRICSGVVSFAGRFLKLSKSENPPAFIYRSLSP